MPWAVPSCQARSCNESSTVGREFDATSAHFILCRPIALFNGTHKPNYRRLTVMAPSLDFGVRRTVAFFAFSSHCIHSQDALWTCTCFGLSIIKAEMPETTETKSTNQCVRWLKDGNAPWIVLGNS